MAYINSDEVEIFANVTFSGIADGCVTKQKLSEDVQKQIYEPDVVTSCGADFAEVGFWADDNTNNEDRLYRFVSIAGNTGKEIKIADANSQIVGTSNIKDNVGFLSGYTEGDENDSAKVIVSIIGVVPVKTNDNTIVVGDRVMSDDNGFAVKSQNKFGYRVLNVNNGLLTIVVSPNTDMIQRIKTDMLENVDKFSERIDDKQDKLTAGAGITITDNGVISSDIGLKIVVLKDGEDLPGKAVDNTIYFKRNTETDDESTDWYEEYIWVNNWWECIGTTKIDLSAYAQKSELPTKTSDLTNDSNFVSDANYIHTDNNFTTAEKTKLGSLVNYDDTAIKKQIAEKQDKLTKIQLENIAAVTEKIDKSAVGNGLKFANGQLQLDIPVATASTTYGGDAQ